MPSPLVVYVDVDDMLIRSIGSKMIPVGGMADHVRSLHASGAILYCWSTGGSAYAKSIAETLKIDACFAGFLPKPQVLIDDQPPSDWRNLIHVHPLQSTDKSLAAYRQLVEQSHR